MFPSLAVLSANGLLALAAFAIVALVVLIARFKCNAFVAIILAALVVGLGSGMPLNTVASAFEAGVAKTLGGLAMIIGLGTILAKLLAESGAATVIARTMVGWFGKRFIDYGLMLVAFLIGISVFFPVGIVLLGPIGFMLARETKTPILRLMLPVAAGLSTAHGLIPPHPGPMAAIATLKADIGRTILWSLVVGAPTALITGPFLARWVAPYVPVEIGGLGAESTNEATAPRRPSFAISLFTMLLPVLLMLAASGADILLSADNLQLWLKDGRISEATMGTLTTVRMWADLLGAPTIAMLIAVLVSFWTFGTKCGLTGAQILKFSEVCLAPAAGILLIIGAGGGFSNVLNASGVGKAIGEMGKSLALSPLLLGWIIAGLLRISVGSATVAVTTAASLMAPIVGDDPKVNKELLVLALGAGSLIMSHVNDSGFWLMKEYLGLSVQQTLKTWTVVETGIAVVSIVIILLVSAVI